MNDVRAAIQYVKHNAADLKTDPDRLALMGDSAGGHLTALVGLAGALPPFKKAYVHAHLGVRLTMWSRTISSRKSSCTRGFRDRRVFVVGVPAR